MKEGYNIQRGTLSVVQTLGSPYFCNWNWNWLIKHFQPNITLERKASNWIFHGRHGQYEAAYHLQPQRSRSMLLSSRLQVQNNGVLQGRDGIFKLWQLNCNCVQSRVIFLEQDFRKSYNDTCCINNLMTYPDSMFKVKLLLSRNCTTLYSTAIGLFRKAQLPQ